MGSKYYQTQDHSDKRVYAIGQIIIRWTLKLHIINMNSENCYL